MEQTNVSNWLEEENKQLQSEVTTYERLPALKLEENKMVEIVVDTTKPFDRWVDPQTQAIKKIIPCMYNGVKHVFWLNVKNPAYNEIIKGCIAGQNKFRIIRTGQAKATRYTIVKD